MTGGSNLRLVKIYGRIRQYAPHGPCDDVFRAHNKYARNHLRLYEHEICGHTSRCAYERAFRAAYKLREPQLQLERQLGLGRVNLKRLGPTPRLVNKQG